MPLLLIGTFIFLFVSLASSINTYSSEECRDAKEEAEYAANELEYAARRLASCASNHDYYDDCYSEFRAVKNAYDDYESTVSRVSSECD